MAKRHKKEIHEEHVDESWLIPYADLLTLLLALFIVLFASSNIDQSKAEMLGGAMSNEFGIFEPSSNDIVINPEDGGSTTTDGIKIDDILDTIIKVQSQNSETDTSTDTSNENTDAEDFPLSKLQVEKEKTVKALTQNLNDLIAGTDLENQLEVIQTEAGISIVLKNDAWFESGSAVITASHLQSAKEIGTILATEVLKNSSLPFMITVSGHTDKKPINNAKYANNMVLSMDRAYNFMQVLVDYSNLKMENFSVQGFGDSRPLDTADTPEAYAKNRRVEVDVNFELPE